MHEEEKENSNAGNPVGNPRPLSLLPAVKGQDTVFDTGPSLAP